VKIITGFYHPDTPDYNEYIDNLVWSASLLGYDVSVYEAFTQYSLDYVKKCQKGKPEFILNVLGEGDDVLWVDADCLIMNPIDWSDFDADICFTLRDIPKDYPHGINQFFIDGSLNTGVMMFRNRPKVKDFLTRVISLVPESFYDQDAFARVVSEYTNMKAHNETVEKDGLRIKILNCRDYNCFYFPLAKNVKIAHFKDDECMKFYHSAIERLKRGDK